MVGWFGGVVLWPLKMLCPEWVVAMRYISAFGMAVCTAGGAGSSVGSA